ncbi:hypothetical protein ACFWYW_49460 [Nonomuraea sp. NPDC059023]|uniref:hypothetical protein n=1 Tax=unclassified Nonomuraea TaxID=2593643 RepID=UPI0036B040D6
MTGPSSELRSLVSGLNRRADIRYYLTAGTGEFWRPSWAFTTPKGDGPDRSAVASILDCAGERAAFADQEVQAIESWIAAPGSAQKRLVLETIGAPSQDDLAFWQACRLRLRSTRATMLVLRHDPGPAQGGQAQPQAKEILLGLLLSGGYAWAREFDRWAALRRWDASVIEACTSTRDTTSGRLYTYAGLREKAQAWHVFEASAPATVEELARMVVATQADPLLASAALVSDVCLALAALSPLACAEAAAHPRGIARYGRQLFHRGRHDRWKRIEKATAATCFLAAVLVNRKRITPATATAILNLTEHLGVDADVRSLFAYTLGQRLAKDDHEDDWTASIRCFDYVHACHRAHPHDYVGLDATRHAAAYNGAALAHLRLGDHAGSIEAELAALDALAEPGVLETGLYEQQVLVLANLGRVYGQTGQTQQALDCYRLSWRIAAEDDSLGGLAHAGAGLVRLLVEAGEFGEAERVTADLLRSYDSAEGPGRHIERAVVGSCWVLADRSLSAGDVRSAAEWYAEAVHRMTPGRPKVIESIIQNLGRHAEAGPVMEVLETALAEHRATAADLESLRGLLEEREADD